MGNEESLVGFPVKQVVPALVSAFMVAMGTYSMFSDVKGRIILEC